MFGSLSYSELAFKLMLVLAPLYLVYRVWRVYQKSLSDRSGKSH